MRSPRRGCGHNGCMGLFTQRPEEPSEWAGLPAEPQRPRSGAEMLPAGPPPGDPADLLGLGGGVSSVSIPLSGAPADGAGDGDGDRDSSSGEEDETAPI